MIYILGAGGYAREVLDIFIDLNRDNEVVAFLEENCQRKGHLLNGKQINEVSILESLDRSEIRLICAIGNPIRKRLIEHTKKLGYKYETLFHPSVVKSKWVEYGEGVIISAGNILTNQISIGDFSLINYGCTIAHDVKIGKFTTISPGTHISGKVTIGDECFIGTGAVIVEKVNIGKATFIGAGAVVTKDIPGNVLALGTPAKPIKKLTKSDWKELI